MNIFREITSEGTLFKDERVFRPDYVPAELLFREKHISEIARSVRPAAHGKQPQNLLLYGPSGTGKTSCARFVLRELSEYSQRAQPIYLNCWEYSSRHMVLHALLEGIGMMAPKRGLSSNEIMEKVVGGLRQSGKIPILVLDEVDRLFAASSEEQKVLYDLGRMPEIHGLQIGLVGITNNRDVLVRADARTKSSLMQGEIEFSKYSPQELKGILSERAKLGYCDGALEKEVVPLCAAISAKNGGDARVALALLWKAGLEADGKGAKKVLVEHVKAVQEKCIQEAKTLGIRKEEELAEMERRIVKIIAAEGGSIESGELYEQLGAAMGEERAVRLHIAKMVKSGVLEEKETNDKGRKKRILGIRGPK
jgi:cell division control protein 6